MDLDWTLDVIFWDPFDRFCTSNIFGETRAESKISWILKSNRQFWLSYSKSLIYFIG